MKLLPSVFMTYLYSRLKIFVFVLNSIGDIFLYFCVLVKDYKKRIKNQRQSLPSAVNVILKLSNVFV